MDRSMEIRRLCEEKQIRMIDFKMTDGQKAGRASEGGADSQPGGVSDVL